ncbi:hypothetical protein BC628DRAFT_592410 [Trametes gibbosa]|nr:hypothetical protein BC628DRAFT_592410 [Trametes gibbosa]
MCRSYSYVSFWAFLGQLDWYTSVVGESPCVTYQRLRQICNGDYEVPNFRPNTPGDNCDDQVSTCCCNTVAFQSHSCQQDHLAGNQIGIDAGVGAYTLYRGGCGAGTNNSLPTDIQSAVCNRNIRLDNFVYGGWADGSWYAYIFCCMSLLYLSLILLISQVLVSLVCNAMNAK